jgi:hypothetical protein
MSLPSEDFVWLGWFPYWVSRVLAHVEADVKLANRVLFDV